ncbi:MAG: glycosyltransferase family 2 protein [Planctomycetota bacterium]
MVWIVLIGGAVVFAVWGWVNAAPRYRGTFGHVLRAGDFDGVEASGSAVMIVPGRDEAEHLSRTLPAMCGQDHADCGVVFVDDASGDGTPVITAELSERYPNLRVMRTAGGVPAGWVGKPWAVMHGVRAVLDRGSAVWDRLSTDELAVLDAAVGEMDAASEVPDWVCFTDADMDWQPGCLRTAIAWAEREQAGLVGLLPEVRFGSFGEALVQAQLGLALGLLFPIPRSNDMGRPEVLIGGAFILVRREVYESVGGHAAVRGQVVEDIRFGEVVKAALREGVVGSSPRIESVGFEGGWGVRVAFAEGLLGCRMYDGWADQWEGLTKNAYAGTAYRLDRVIAMVPALVVTNVLPPVFVGVGLWGVLAVGGWVWGAGLVLSAMGWLCTLRPMDRVRRRMGLSWWHALLMPAGSAVYLAILVASVWRYYRGGNAWKGRRYGKA